MNIINILAIGKQLVAGCRNGWLLLWDILADIDSSLTDIDGLSPSVTLSRYRLRLAPQLRGLLQSEKKLIGYNASALYVVLKSDICEGRKHDLPKQVTSIKFDLGQQEINYLAVLSEDMVLVGTDTSQVFQFDLQTRTIIRSIKLYDENKERPRISLFRVEPPRKVELTSIVLHNQQPQAYVSLNNGYIYQVQLTSFMVVQRLTTYADDLASLMPIQTPELLISIHQNYILGWNVATNQCTFKIQASEATAVLCLNENIFLIVGNYPEMHWAWESAVHTVGLSVRSSSCAKMLSFGSKKYLCVGGNDGLIDVFCKNSHILVLCPSSVEQRH